MVLTAPSDPGRSRAWAPVSAPHAATAARTNFAICGQRRDGLVAGYAKSCVTRAIRALCPEKPLPNAQTGTRINAENRQLEYLQPKKCRMTTKHRDAGASLTHTNNFDAIRIAAALAVLVSHHHALTGQFEPLVLGIHTLGGFAVLVFFAVSGYLVTSSWYNDPHLIRFTLRRALRIWPAFIAVIALTAFGLGSWVTSLATDEYLRHADTRGYLSNIWFVGKGALPGVFEQNPLPSAVNGSIWTISYEVLCYVVLAGAGVLGILRIRTVSLMVILAIVIWYEFKRGPDFHSDWKLKYEMMAYFLAGAAIFMLQTHWSKRPLTWLAVVLTIGLSLWFSGLRYLAFLTTVPYLIICLGTRSSPVFRQFGHWGDPSYGMYLMAFPIQQTTIQLLLPSVGFAGTMSLAILCTTILAYASWHGLEKRALKLKPRKS